MAHAPQISKRVIIKNTEHAHTPSVLKPQILVNSNLKISNNQ